MSRRRTQHLVLAVTVLIGLAAVGFVQGSGGGSDAGFFVGGESADDSVAEDIAADGQADFSNDGGVQGGHIAMGGSGSGASGATGGSNVALSRQGADEDAGAPPAPSLPASGFRDRIIKDGRMEVEVPEGRFDEAFGAALRLADGVNGQVVASQSTGDRDGRSSGEVTIRVPAERFEELLTTAGTIGDVQSSRVTSQDVSGEFTDLQSRLRHLQAQERFYLELLDEAQVVGDAIAVNQHLSQILAEMEQVQGRLRLLEERTTYSRLTVALFEPGTGHIPGLLLREEGGVLAAAWHDALRGLQQTLGALLVGSFTMAPLAALGLLGWAAWRRLRPRPAAEGPRPAGEQQEGPLHVG